MPTDNSARQEEWKWTPRAWKVISTARAIAAPARRIGKEDLLLAMESVALEYGDNVAPLALARMGVRPSAVLSRQAPETCPPSRPVSPAEFDASLSAIFPALVIDEARGMGNDYMGIEHLLLFLARTGVPGVDLSYDRIRQTILELMGQS